MRIVLAVVLASMVSMFLAGCISPEEQEQAGERLALEAKDRAYDKAYTESIKLGASPDQAAKIATTAGETAYKLAKEAAERAPKTGTLGQIAAILLWLGTNIGLPLLKKKEGLA